MSFPNRRARQIPGWALIPILIFGVGGGFLVWEQAQPEAQEQRAREAVRGRVDRANSLVDAEARAQVIARGLAGIPKTDDPSVRMLTTAIQEGDDVAVRELLKRVTPAELASQTWMMGRCFQLGDVSMVRTLLDGGVPAQAPPRTAIPNPPTPSAQSKARSSKVPKGTEGGGVGYAIIPLVEAIVYRSVDGARLLLEHGADPDRTVTYPPSMIERVVKGVRLNEFVAEGSKGGAPTAGKVEPPEVRTYTIRQLALRCDDPAMRALFQDAAMAKKATHVAARTSQ